MEWVETVGKTIDEAKEAALDRLGVAEDEAEFEILEEPKAGLFGRVRGEARVSARVRPATPRQKVDRRRGRKPKADSAEAAPADTTSDTAATAPVTAVADESSADPAPATKAASTPSRGTGRSRGGRGATKQSSPSEADSRPEKKEKSMDDVSVAEQAEVIAEFLDGLLDAFGVEGSIEQVDLDEDTIEIRVTGNDLGLLIGPKGQTLQSVQELGRSVAQRRLAGPHLGRVRLDIGGYRQRRSEALERFTKDVAAKAIDEGVRKVLEPMSAPDRKVVHDVANGIDGVHTESEGEDPRRRVVIIPD
jgi:spoIIIJ-associated protein